MIVNGKEMSFDRELDIQGLLDELDLGDRPLVVEVDGVIYRKENYDHKLKDDSVIEIVAFVGGG